METQRAERRSPGSSIGFDQVARHLVAATMAVGVVLMLAAFLLRARGS